MMTLVQLILLFYQLEEQMKKILYVAFTALALAAIALSGFYQAVSAAPKVLPSLDDSISTCSVYQGVCATKRAFAWFERSSLPHGTVGKIFSLNGVGDAYVYAYVKFGMNMMPATPTLAAQAEFLKPVKVCFAMPEGGLVYNYVPEINRWFTVATFPENGLTCLKVTEESLLAVK
jgi:hypothetical protein